jgi:HlyD family secretion protein
VAVARGRAIGELVEVKGLKAGDKVVLAPGADLRDGQAVKVARK